MALDFIIWLLLFLTYLPLIYKIYGSYCLVLTGLYYFDFSTRIPLSYSKVTRSLLKI